MSLQRASRSATLLVTNDFPPRAGGIEQYLHGFATRLPAEELVVHAAGRGAGRQQLAEFDAAQPFRVVRDAATILLPTPAAATRVAQTMRRFGCGTVWFGAAAPLGLLGPTLRRAGAGRVVASTHGHEIGWSMTPGGRWLLGRIGQNADVITTVSRYTKGRLEPAFGSDAVLEPLPCGVDTARFRPDAAARARVRAQLGIRDVPVALCVGRLVPRKGQDELIRAWPRVLLRAPEAVLLLVGRGPDHTRLRRLARRAGVAGNVRFCGEVAGRQLPEYYNVADVFAMPCRTRGGGLDVEGMGLVFLEAAACGLPVIAGADGGAPETVLAGRTGRIVRGRNGDVAGPLAELLTNRPLARHMGEAGRSAMLSGWDWQPAADRLLRLLRPPAR